MGAGQEGGYVLIRDHATQHSSAESQALLQLVGVMVMVDFPAQGWDLNIIENVWGVFVGKLVGKHAHTTDGVIKAIRQAWAEVPMEAINKLVASVPSRMQQVVEKGGHGGCPRGTSTGCRWAGVAGGWWAVMFLAAQHQLGFRV